MLYNIVGVVRRVSGVIILSAAARTATGIERRGKIVIIITVIILVDESSAAAAVPAPVIFRRRRARFYRTGSGQRPPLLLPVNQPSSSARARTRFTRPTRAHARSLPTRERRRAWCTRCSDSARYVFFNFF